MDYYAELLHLVRVANPTCPILCLVPDATTTSAEVSREGQARTSGRCLTPPAVRGVARVLNRGFLCMTSRDAVWRLQECVAAAIIRAREHKGVENVHYEVCVRGCPLHSP